MLPTLNTLWIKGPLSHLERICLASMRKQGHRVVLHTYGRVENIPKGIVVKDAAEILPFDDTYRHEPSGSISVFADYFRYVLLKKQLGVWIDLDCFCLAPIEIPPHGYLLGHETNTINGAVLHLPSDSPVLDDLLTACRNPGRSPYWLDFRRRYLKRLWFLVTGRKWHLGVMGWGIVCPVALTRLIPRYGLLNKVQPTKTFYPVDRQGSAKLFDPEPFGHLVEDTDIKTIHIYAKQRKWEKPVPGSFMEWATEYTKDFL